MPEMGARISVWPSFTSAFSPCAVAASRRAALAWSAARRAAVCSELALARATAASAASTCLLSDSTRALSAAKVVRAWS